MTKLAIQLLVLHFTPQIIFFQASIQAHKVFPSKNCWNYSFLSQKCGKSSLETCEILLYRPRLLSFWKS